MPIVHVTISIPEQIPAILNRIITVDYEVHLLKTVRYSRWLVISIAKESKKAS